MHVIFMLLLIGATVCFGLGALSTRRRVGGVDALSFICIGLLLWVLVPTIRAVAALN